jgi:multidrug efflux system membrane fusion protein
VRKQRIILAIVVIVCLGGAAAWRFGAFDHTTETAGKSAGQGQAAAAVPATVEAVHSADFDVLLRGLGTVQPLNTVTVRSRVDGEITKISFREGQVVAQNDPLAQIDPKPYQAALAQATAKKAQDQAQLQNAKADLQRYAQLAKKDFATAQQLDTQTSTVAQDTAQIQSDEAAIDNAQTQLGYTDIRAPLAGLVGFRLVDQGNIITAANQTGIAVITQIEPISVVFTLPEGDIDRLSKAMRQGAVQVTAATTDGSRQLAVGKVSVLNNQVDTTTGMIQVKATFDNKDHALWPGLAVSVQVNVETLKDVIVLSQSAVEHGPQGLWTYVVSNDDHVAVRPIELGDSNDSDVVVTKGLKSGERVVTAGQYRLQAGAKISTATADNDPANDRNL